MPLYFKDMSYFTFGGSTILDGEAKTYQVHVSSSLGLSQVISSYADVLWR